MSDTADDERLADLLGDLGHAVRRGLAAGCDVSDVLTCVGHLAGQLLADSGHVEVSGLVVSVGLHTRRVHAARLAQLAREADERGLNGDVYRSGSARRPRR